MYKTQQLHFLNFISSTYMSCRNASSSLADDQLFVKQLSFCRGSLSTISQPNFCVWAIAKVVS